MPHEISSNVANFGRDVRDGRHVGLLESCQNLAVFHAWMWDATGNGGGRADLPETCKLHKSFRPGNCGRHAGLLETLQILELCRLGRGVVIIILEAALGY